jgi:hypothetical protein
VMLTSAEPLRKCRAVNAWEFFAFESHHGESGTGKVPGTVR